MPHPVAPRHVNPAAVVLHMDYHALFPCSQTPVLSVRRRRRRGLICVVLSPRHTRCLRLRLKMDAWMTIAAWIYHAWWNALQMRHPRFPCHVRLPRMGREAWMYSRSRHTSSRHRRQHSPHQRRLPLSRTIVRLHRTSRATVGRTLAPLSCSRCPGWTRLGQTIWLRVAIEGGEWSEEESVVLGETGMQCKCVGKGG